MSVSVRSKFDRSEKLHTGQQTVELRNSDRIRLKFGSYGIKVTESGQRIRVSNLYSIDKGVKTNRTYAVVVYPPAIDPAFGKEHKEIINGQSIGIVFRNNSWLIEKSHRYFGTVKIGSEQSVLSSVFGDIGTVQPAIHVYSLFIKKNGAVYHYASIAEVHHPDYLNLDDLGHIYGAEFDSALAKDDDTKDFLNIVKTRMLRA